MASVKVTTADFKEKVLMSDKTVLVDFWADWCGPCKMIGPVVEEISDERNDILVCKVNVDEEQALLMKYKVMSIPTLISFKNGEIYKKSIGAISKSEILELVD